MNICMYHFYVTDVFYVALEYVYISLPCHWYVCVWVWVWVWVWVCMCMCVGVGVGVCVPEYNLVNVTSAVYMHVCVYKYIHKYLHTFIQSVSISLPLHIKSYWIPGVLKKLTSASVMLLHY